MACIVCDNTDNINCPCLNKDNEKEKKKKKKSMKQIFIMKKKT